MKQASRHLFQKELQSIGRFSMLCKCIHIPYGILMPVMVSAMTMQAIGGAAMEVLRIGAALCLLSIGYGILNSRLKVRLKRLTAEGQQQCKLQLYEAFFGNSLEALHHSSLGGNLENFHDDFTAVTERMVQDVPGFAAALMESLLFGLYVCYLSPPVAAVMFGIALIQAVPPLVVKKYMQVNYDAARDIEGEITDFIVTAFEGFLLIKLYQLQDWWLGKLNGLYQEYKAIGRRSIYTCQSQAVMYSLLDNLLKYGTYCMIGMLALSGVVPIQTGVQAIAMSASFYAAVQNAFRILPRFVAAGRAEVRIMEWYGAQGSCQGTVQGSRPGTDGGICQKTGHGTGGESCHGISQGTVQGSCQGTSQETGRESSRKKRDGHKIGMAQVSFSYGDGRGLLENASADMDCGRLNVVKGPNGMGKSTLFRLLLGMEHALDGEIKIGGKAPQMLAASCFPAEVFLLAQEIPAFEMTAWELYGSVLKRLGDRGTGAKSRLQQNVERFCLDEGMLKERGMDQLSQGERKKVFLALAFSIDPPFLFLDEPENHLDGAGKEALRQMLKERGGGAVIISHDALLWEMAECRWQLQGGKLVYENAYT